MTISQACGYFMGIQYLLGCRGHYSHQGVALQTILVFLWDVPITIKNTLTIHLP